MLRSATLRAERDAADGVLRAGRAERDVARERSAADGAGEVLRAAGRTKRGEVGVIAH